MTIFTFHIVILSKYIISRHTIASAVVAKYVKFNTPLIIHFASNVGHKFCVWSNYYYFIWEDKVSAETSIVAHLVYLSKKKRETRSWHYNYHVIYKSATSTYLDCYFWNCGNVFLLSSGGKFVYLGKYLVPCCLSHSTERYLNYILTNLLR